MDYSDEAPIGKRVQSAKFKIVTKNAMQKLNRQNVSATLYPERIIQFGDGNFLLGFIEWIVWNMNKTVDFNSGIVVVKAREHGSVETLNAQDGL